MRLLDLFCGAGGAAMGYHRAGFEVVGVDINPQPHYPFEFHRADAMEYLDNLLELFGDGTETVWPWDVIHASPPCQAYSLAQRLQDNEHPDLVATVRQMLKSTGLPYVIENVVGAPLLDPVLLCGSSFPELSVYRHRLFESSVMMPLFPHLGHGVKLTKLGHPPVDGEFMHVVGHVSGVVKARAAMGIDWYVTQSEVAEAIPPAYTEWIGRQLIAAMERAA